MELLPPPTHDLIWAGEPERYEEQPGLVDVGVILIDDGNLDLVLGQHPTQSIGSKRPARASAQEAHPRLHPPFRPPGSRRGHFPKLTSRAWSAKRSSCRPGSHPGLRHPHIPSRWRGKTGTGRRTTRTRTGRFRAPRMETSAALA